MADQIEIRPATVADLDEILRLLPQLTTRPAAASAQLPPRDQAIQHLEQILTDPKIQLLVAARPGSTLLLGTITLVIVANLTYSGQPWAMIENVVVERTARRSGVGRCLVEAAIHQAREHGCYKVQLISGPKPEQVAFYRTLGFQTETCVGHKLYLSAPREPGV